MRISLLHATYAAGEAAVSVRDRWMQMAARPELIDHLFAYNSDDPLSASNPRIACGIAGPSMPGAVTAVRNWNSAAAASNGDLLVVIADDLTPLEAGWDDALRGVVGDLDPRAVGFALKVTEDEHRGEHLMRHPVVSRAYFERYGLFDPGYEGIGADNDFTLRAHLRGLVLDGRAIEWRHAHPVSGVTPTESHQRMSSGRSAADGADRFRRTWPRWRRRIWYRYFSPPAGQRSVSALRHSIRRGLVRCGRLRPPAVWRIATSRR